MRPLLLALALGALLSGCSPWAVHYEPRSVRGSSPIVTKAKQVYRDDLQELAGAGGQVIGELAVAVNTGYPPAAEDIIHDQAAKEAAQRGGTHMFHTGNIADESTLVTVNKAFGTTFVQSRQISRVSGYRYIVVRVPAEALKTLDEELRPQ